MANDRLIEVISPQSYEALQELVKALNLALDVTVEWNKELSKLNNMKPSEIKKAYDDTAKSINGAKKSINDYESTQKKLHQAEKNQMQAMQATNEQIQKRRFETQQLNKQAKEQSILTSKLASEYQKLNTRMNQAGRAIQDLVVRKEQGVKLTKQEQAELRRLQKEYDRYQKSILKADATIGRHQRNVGNYGSALRGLGGSLRGLMGAFGLVGGVFLFASAMRDAFKRVKDFDASMQNLAGVMRVSRGDLSDLESVIKNVAGQSVRTSNEVAKLAESLATLGKSKEEIAQLLKPVIDLSIGLEATAAESGEFLVMMLNAFGATTDSAAEYADTIATIRTSTTLDFQKMRDSFAYIAPIARLLNKDLAWTGATVGILADNSIKAESAGRLLSTSLIKLANDGNTLDGALEEVNQAINEGKSEYELLAIAGKLFGAQAAKIGIVLAQNSDSLEKNAQAIRDNGGALEDLVNQQLESVDAKLKILDSAYEQFVLSIENGNGALSKSFGFVLEAATNFFNGLSEWNKSNADVAMEVQNKALETQAKRYKELGIEANTYARIEADNAKNRIIQITNEIAKAERRLELEKDRSFVMKLINGDMKKFENAVDSLNLSLATQEGILEAANKQLGVFSGHMQDMGDYGGGGAKTIAQRRTDISDLRKELEEMDSADVQAIRTKQKQIDLLQKELDGILGTTKATREKTIAREKEISVMKQWNELMEKNAKIGKILDDRMQKSAEKELEGLTANTEGLAAYTEQIRKQAAERIKNANSAEYESEKIREAFIGLGASLGIQAETVSSLFDDIKNGFKDTESSIESFKNLFLDALNSISANQRAQMEGQIDRLERQKEIEIAFAGDSARAKEVIEERYERQIAQLKKKQAQNEKRQAIISATINTAAAVVKTFAELGWPAGIVGGALIGALGAAQIAVIASQPIPQFKDGVRNFEGGQAIVGDGGKREPITDKTGKLIGMSPSRSTLVDLPKGSNVYSSQSEFINELNGMLGNNSINPIGNAIGNPIVMVNAGGGGMSKADMEEVMRRTLGNMPRNVTTFDKNGISTYAQKQYGKVQSLNNRVTHKGISV